jgi:hypothetical protein
MMASRSSRVSRAVLAVCAASDVVATPRSELVGRFLAGVQLGLQERLIGTGGDSEQAACELEKVRGEEGLGF